MLNTRRYFPSPDLFELAGLRESDSTLDSEPECIEADICIVLWIQQNTEKLKT